MKNIIKSKEPKSLTEYRCGFKDKELSREIFNGFSKKELREYLLSDQGYICCYCMQGIKNDSSIKIEHLKPVSKYKEKILDYNNLFVACHGVVGAHENTDNRKIRHCDTSKGDCEGKYKKNKEINCDLTIDLKDCEKYITGYTSSGEIRYENLVEKDIEEILNLNNYILKRNRKSAWVAVISAMNSITKGKKDPWSKADIRNKINEYKAKDRNGKYKSYCQFIIYHLEKKWRRL